MDPNETLAGLRAQIAAYRRGEVDTGDIEDAWHALAVIVDHVEALDTWLSKGGFLPEAWQHGHRYTRAAIVDGTGWAPGQTFTSDPLGPPNPAGVEMP